MQRRVALLLSALFILAAPGSGAAATGLDQVERHEAVRPADVGPLRVETLDRTADRCWENQEQVEDYAASRLERNGFEVLRDGRQGAESTTGYVLFVGVIADRVNGRCSGTLQIFLAKPSWRDGKPGRLMVGPDTTHLSSARSFDLSVLGKVRNFVEHL